MRRIRWKTTLCMVAAVVFIVAAVNFTIPDKLIRLHVDRVEPTQIEYTLASWSFRPFVTGFLEESVFVFKQVDNEWNAVPPYATFRHDIGVNMPPFYHHTFVFEPEESLEPGIYKICFYYHIKGSSKTTECVFEVKG